MRFKGTKDYVATDDLKVAVNAAITLQRPLLVNCQVRSFRFGHLAMSNLPQTLDYTASGTD